MSPPKPGRRDFLKSSMASSVALLVGCHSETLYGPEVGSDDGTDGVGGLDADVSPDLSAPDLPTQDPGDSRETSDDIVSDAEIQADGDANSLDGEVDAEPACDDPFLGGEMLAVLPFYDEDTSSFHVKVNAGWDGRLYTDLRTLEADGLIIPTERFYLRTFEPDLKDVTLDWSLTLDGLVETPVTLTMADLTPLIAPRGVHLLECSGNGRSRGFGLMSACAWDGVLLSDVLAMVTPQTAGVQVRVEGYDGHSVPSTHSTPGASWVFTLQQLAEAGAFIATGMNGAPLVGDHGAPARLFIPNWYGCCAIKWLDRITFVDATEPPTAQMQEFATRTHQVQPLPLAAIDFQPATMDQAAMPVRIEQWALGGETLYRIIGVMWGGYEPTTALEIQVGSGAWESVTVCPAQTTNDTWTLWTHAWNPVEMGLVGIRLRVTDASVPTTRLDSEYYLREVVI